MGSARTGVGIQGLRLWNLDSNTVRSDPSNWEEQM